MSGTLARASRTANGGRLAKRAEAKLDETTEASPDGQSSCMKRAEVARLRRPVYAKDQSTQAPYQHGPEPAARRLRGAGSHPALPFAYALALVAAIPASKLVQLAAMIETGRSAPA